MRTYTTYSYRFYTHSEKGKCKCSRCGKTITKSFSFEYREDTAPSNEDLQALQEEKQAWESKEHICTACLKSAVINKGNDITNKYSEDFNNLINMHNKRIEFEKKMNEEEEPIFKKLKNELKGKILITKDREWVIDSICNGWNGESFQLNCTGIDKQKPWTKCDKYLYAGDINKHHNQGNSYWIGLNECKITDEVFDDRKAKYNSI